jgi:preprotein translocase subunit SecD
MRLFILAVFGVILMQTPLMAGSDKPAVVLRLHLQNLDSQDMSKVTPLPLKNPDQLIYVDKFAFLSEKYLYDAKQLQDGRVIIQFDNIGVSAMETTTSASLGKIMVVIFNGRVILAAVIDKPIRDGRLIVPDISPEEFKQMELLIKKNRST